MADRARRSSGGIDSIVRALLPIAALVLAIGALASHATANQPVDVVFVLDNSGSMRQNDPEFLTRAAVTNFANALAQDPELDARLGVVLFDGQARLVRPLTAANTSPVDALLESPLAALDFSGQRTNSPAGVERALYELRENGREEARRAIVFLTDGKIDTGDAQSDYDAAWWLREELAQEAESLGIRIFGVAFTDAADYQLLQAIAQKTRASYYRAYRADELGGVVNDILGKVAAADFYALATSEAAPLASGGAAATVSPDGDAAPNVASAPARTDGVFSPGSWGWLPVAVLLVAGVLLWRRKTPLPSVDALIAQAELDMDAPAAQLLDFGGQLGETGTALPLKRGRNRIGRDKNNDIVLDDDAISSEHAVIEVHDGRYWIEDRRSTNGTRLGDKRIAPEQRMQLKGGDHVRFAEIDLMFVLAGYVPGGATVFLNSSTSPPAGWRSGFARAESVLPARESSREPEVPEPESRTAPPEIEIAAQQAEPHAESFAFGTDASTAEAEPAAGPARHTDDDGADAAAPPSAALEREDHVRLAEARERLDPAPVEDLDSEWTDPGATPRPPQENPPETAASDPSRSRPHISLLPDPPADPADPADLAASAAPAEEHDTATAEPPPEEMPEARPGHQAAVLTPADAGDRYRDCLDYHLDRVAEISEAFDAFIQRAFDPEIRAALCVTARELITAAQEQGGALQSRDYTANRVRYVICGMTGEMESAQQRYVETYGGFTRMLTEQLQSESFRKDGCEILAILTFGAGQAPWVSLSVVPDEDQDPRIDLLSYEFLTQEERQAIEPGEHSDVSQSGLG